MLLPGDSEGGVCGGGGEDGGGEEQNGDEDEEREGEETEEVRGDTWEQRYSQLESGGEPVSALERNGEGEWEWRRIMAG